MFIAHNDVCRAGGTLDRFISQPVPGSMLSAPFEDGLVHAGNGVRYPITRCAVFERSLPRAGRKQLGKEARDWGQTTEIPARFRALGERPL